MNDPTERGFGEMTGQLQYFGQIGIIRAEYVQQVHINGYLSHGFYVNPKKKSGQMVIFHKLSNKMWLYLIKVAPEYSQAIRDMEGDDIKKNEQIITVKKSY